MGPILEAKNLTMRYTTRNRPPVTAVDGVSFSLPAGQVLGVVGRSGCGKSTLARLLCGLEVPTSGQVLLRGQALESGAPPWREVQMVFQTPAGSFDPRRTLGDGVGESLKNTGVPAKRRQELVAALLEKCGLEPDLARRYPHQVSGGECQRAAIARALAVGPRVLICDEATSSLDVTVQGQIVRLLQRLVREEGLTCLFISHSLALVRLLCQSALVMEAGRIVEQGPMADLIAHPTSPHTQALLDAAL